MQQQAADRGVLEDCSDGRDDEAFKQAVTLLLYFALLRGFSKCMAALFALNFMIRVRVELTRAIHQIYMDPISRSYYVLNQLDHSLDSVDQRITADVDIALQYMTEAFFGGLFKAETGFLFNFSGTVCAVILGCYGRWYLPPPDNEAAGAVPCLIAFSFILVFFPLNALFAGRVARVQMQQQALEGKFRGAHARVCQNSENIRFYGGEATEL